MEEALTRALLMAAPIRDLVGNRITWNEQKQGAGIPAIVLQRISGAPEYDNGGATGIESARVQVDCFGATSDEARRIGRAVKARVSGISEIIDDVEFQEVLIDSERSDSAEGGAAAKLHRVSIDLIIWFTA